MPLTAWLAQLCQGELHLSQHISTPILALYNLSICLHLLHYITALWLILHVLFKILFWNFTDKVLQTVLNNTDQNNHDYWTILVDKKPPQKVVISQCKGVLG